MISPARLCDSGCTPTTRALQTSVPFTRVTFRFSPPWSARQQQRFNNTQVCDRRAQNGLFSCLHKRGCHSLSAHPQLHDLLQLQAVRGHSHDASSVPACLNSKDKELMLPRRVHMFQQRRPSCTQQFARASTAAGSLQPDSGCLTLQDQSQMSQCTVTGPGLAAAQTWDVTHPQSAGRLASACRWGNRDTFCSSVPGAIEPLGGIPGVCGRCL